MAILGMPSDPAVFAPWIHVAADSPRLHPWISHNRCLTHWLMVYADLGAERILVDGRPYDIPAGSSYLIQPGSSAELRSAVGNRPVWAHFDLAFDPRRAEHPQVHVHAPTLGVRAGWMQPRAQDLLGLDLPVVIPIALQPRIAADLPEVVRLWSRGDLLSVRRAAHELGGLVLAVAEHVRGDSAIAMSPDQRLHRAEEAVRAGLVAGAGLETMAAAAGLGRSRFCELYSRQRGISPGAYIRAERLRRARELLSTSDLDVGEIAVQVGFADATVFGRFFRVATGLTPSAWRARGS
jgi:AraC-like DNA-binding protein